MVINFPQVINSLTSIMSTGYFFDPQLISVSRDLNKKFLKIIYELSRKLMTLEKRIKLRLTIDNFRQGNGDYILDIDRQISLYQFKCKIGRNKSKSIPISQQSDKDYGLKNSRIKKDHYPHINYLWHQRPINKL